MDCEGFLPRTVGRKSIQIDPEDDPPVRSGRFALLSSDSDDSPNVHVCRAPSRAVDCGRVAVLSSRTVPPAPKRLRLTSRNLRMSQASTMPAAEFDLTRANSDRTRADRSRQTSQGLNHEWEEGNAETLGDLEEEVHDTVADAAPVLAVCVPEIPEDVEMHHLRMRWTCTSGVDPFDVAKEETLEMDRFPLAGVRVGLTSLDTVKVEALFWRRGCLMKNVPKFLVGPQQIWGDVRGLEALLVGTSDVVVQTSTWWFDQQRKVDRPICEVCQNWHGVMHVLRKPRWPAGGANADQRTKKNCAR